MSGGNHGLLDRYLAPLRQYLSDPTVTEIMVNGPGRPNGPGRLFVERGGVMEFHDESALTYDHLLMLAEQAGMYSGQPQIGKSNPLLVAELPEGGRLQCVLPPATEAGTVLIAIRQSTIRNLTLDDYAEQGGYTNTVRAIDRRYPEHLIALYREGNYHTFVKEAIKAKLTILVSGGTASGKTTYMNACLREVEHTERLVTIEDVRELRLMQSNVAHLLFPRRSAPLASHITPRDLVEATLRLRPDRIIFGELRGPEAFDFLSAINTGHPGSIATLHANSAAEAIRRLTTLVLQAETHMSEGSIEEYVRGTVDVVVQVAKTGPRQWGAVEVAFSGG